MPASLSTAACADQEEGLPEVTPQPLDGAGCDVCRHAIVDHDAIALRFCRATQSAAIVRGCVCQPA
jgi:hypothetical protein